MYAVCVRCVCASYILNDILDDISNDISNDIYMPIGLRFVQIHTFTFNLPFSSSSFLSLSPNRIGHMPIKDQHFYVFKRIYNFLFKLSNGGIYLCAVKYK